MALYFLEGSCWQGSESVAAPGKTAETYQNKIWWKATPVPGKAGERQESLGRNREVPRTFFRQVIHCQTVRHLLFWTCISLKPQRMHSRKEVPGTEA